MCRSGNGIFYGTVFLPLIATARSRTQALMALLLACGVFSYPLLRLNDAFPHEKLVSAATAIPSHRRASSVPSGRRRWNRAA